MIRRTSQSKINTLTRYSPTVYTLSTAICTALTPFLIISLVHTPCFELKFALVLSMCGFVYSVWQWLLLVLGQK